MFRAVLRVFDGIPVEARHGCHCGISMARMPYNSMGGLAAASNDANKATQVPCGTAT